jgi:uncharacterized protein (TIGR01777 family)
MLKHNLLLRRGGVPMRILISGSSGLVGSAVVDFLSAQGHQITRLVRREARHSAEMAWDPDGPPLEASRLEPFEAIIHLAGESLSDGRWNAAKKARIRQSRVQGTQQLCRSLAATRERPKVLVSASAIGFYGNRGEELLDENSPAGTGFLAEVCREWEAATAPAAEAGVRVVRLRLGMVLSPRGGALARLLPIFRLGLGGRLGTGRQHVSWITLDDLVRVVDCVARDERFAGPVNAVAPHPVSNREFTRALGRALGRPAFFAVPALALRAVAGEMADELLLAGAQVVPRRLVDAGFTFHDAELRPALARMLAGGAGRE